jgi:nucleotide-binding universal stress UspA family protein
MVVHGSHLYFYSKLPGMKNIIVAVDFSEVSVNAARYAVKLAEYYDAGVWIYYAYKLPLTHIEFGYPFVTYAEMQNAAEFEMVELIKVLTGTTKQPVKIETRVEDAVLMDGLNSLCIEVKADLVVMGITGKNALTRLLIGSNTVNAIHHLHCPVLVVPAGAVFSLYQKIGFAADYENAASPAAIDLINNITSDFKAGLHVINVDWNNRHFTPDAETHQVLLHRQLNTGDVRFHNLESEQVATAIHDFAKKEKVDLLIALPKKHNLAEKLFSRSQSQALMYNTDMPVLCIPE